MRKILATLLALLTVSSCVMVVAADEVTGGASESKTASTELSATIEQPDAEYTVSIPATVGVDTTKNFTVFNRPMLTESKNFDNRYLQVDISGGDQLEADGREAIPYRLIGGLNPDGTETILPYFDVDVTHFAFTEPDTESEVYALQDKAGLLDENGEKYWIMSLQLWFGDGNEVNESFWNDIPHGTYTDTLTYTFTVMDSE